ncbi:DUF305 domain-containing protein [uncultured Brevundimonas sp.]|uniref:DUF305 domain-containing protein n=1 Tax=uncultured Brevundimonas sp. TaxID=213418 RepID=UPI0030EB408F|tara:strand:+ start:11486 stop:12094 length:609 start_codon:yes stop_codon:yes gene_type:complete
MTPDMDPVTKPGPDHGPGHGQGHSPNPGHGMSYRRFAVMIVVATGVMFGLMYLNTYAIEHARFSQTRAWMAVVMGATMAAVMLGFMWGQYRDRRLNLIIVTASVLVFAGALGLVRSQATVDDVSWMRAMIPHHSIAILTSERARIRDPRVRQLADGIIKAQLREIDEMEALIDDLERNPTPSGAPLLPPYRDTGAPPPPPAG